jgi:hypothetical protein
MARSGVKRGSAAWGTAGQQLVNNLDMAMQVGPPPVASEVELPIKRVSYTEFVSLAQTFRIDHRSVNVQL